MATISLHHLHAFISVAETGGVRRSAEVLFRASSAVVRSIAALEQDLQVRLFERKGSGMLLTAAGETVRTRALRIDNELQEVRDDALRLSSRSGHAVGGIEILFSERRLRAAVLLAEMHHMPSVAHTLAVSQSAVSQAIAKLEDALGRPLFLRSARGMMPTDAGARWALRFGRVLAELDHIQADIAALNGVLEGTVTIGALPLARTLLLPAAIASLLARHPKLQISSLESPYEELCAGLLSGRIDFIIGAVRPTSGAGLHTASLFEDRIALIASVDHPLASRQRLTLDDLAGFPWVLSRAGTPSREALKAFFTDHGAAPPQPAVETGDLALLRGLLMKGDMLTVLSAHQLHYEIEAGMLATLPLEMSDMTREIGITEREGAHLSPGANALLEEIREVSRTWK